LPTITRLKINIRGLRAGLLIALATTMNFIRSFTAFLTLISFTACSSIPISEDLQKSIIRGAKDKFFTNSARQDVESWKKLQDPFLNKYIAQIGEKVRKQTHVPVLEFVVVDTPVVQAVSVYDTSTIFVTLGMLNSIRNEAELACLLGHEVHHQEQFIKNPNGEKPHSFAKDVYDNLSPDQLHGFGLSQDLEDISYSSNSKSKETEADEQGSLLCGKAGYQAYALSTLQNRIAAGIQNGPLDKLKNLKGTHDELKNRSKHLRKWLEQQGIKESQGDLGLSEYSKAFNKLKSGSLSSAQKSTLQNLLNIENNVEKLESGGKAVTATEISKLTSQLSRIVQREKITYSELAKLNASEIPGDRFMQERVLNSFNRYGNYHNQVASQVLGILEGIGRIALGFTPLGAVIDFHDVVTGNDFFTGEKLSSWERALSAVGLAVGQGHTLRELAIGLRETKTFILEEKIVRQGESLLEGIKSSPTLNKIYEAENYRRTDFYVRPNGEVIPAKGFRYIGSEYKNLDEIMDSGIVRGRESGNYISFNDLHDYNEVGPKLQIPHDGRYKIEFDTKQVLDDVKIPNGKWNTADYLEPITVDNPRFGSGGATQAISSKTIRATRITDLKNGKVMYESAKP
jgi:Zn-dependent protease with chaperone function